MDKAKFVFTFLAATGIIMGGYFFANNVPAVKNAVNGSAIGNRLGLDDALRIGSENGGLFRGEGTAYVPTDAQGNITRMVAQSMFLNMQKLDQGGTNPFGGLDANDPEARAILENTIRSVPSTIFITAIDTKDLKTTTDNSPSAKKRYLDGIDAISKQYFSGAGANRFNIASSQELIDNMEQDCFGSGTSQKNAELGKAYGELYTAYGALTVPSSWVALHKLILGYTKELSEIYRAFVICKEDPIRAYVGMDRLPTVYARAQDIQDMINTKARELGL